MNKYILLCLLNCLPSAAMETSYIHHPSPPNNNDWQAIYQIINNRLDNTYPSPLNYFYCISLPIDDALKVIAIPEIIFADLVPFFNDSFFTNISNNNTLFKKSVEILTQECKKKIQNSLTGSILDTYKTVLLNIFSHLSVPTKNYLINQVHNAIKEKKTYILKGHTGLINDLTLHSPTKQIASASDDTTARIWNMLTGQICTLKHTEPVNTVSFNQDGSQLATATKLGTIYIWNTDTAKRLYTLQQTLCCPHNHAYFTETAKNSLLTCHTVKKTTSTECYCKSSLCIWKCKKNTEPIVSNMFYLPFTNIWNARKIISPNYTVERSELSKIIATKTEYLPSMCSIAFENSIQNKKELKALQNSTILNQLDDVDKTPLKNAITKRLLQLKKIKSESNKTKTNDIKLIELNQQNNPY